MKSADKKRVIQAIAWRIYSSRPACEQISLGSSRQDREQVERDFDLLGVKEFSAKYETYIHKENA